MAKNTVDIEMNVQDAQQAAAWARQRQYILQTIAGMNQLQQAGTQAGAKTQAAFQGLGGTVTNVLGSLKGVAGTLFGISTAVQLFKRELDGIKMRNENALESQLNIAGAQRRAVLSLGHGANLSPQQLISMVEGQRFVLPQTAYLAAESGISGAGPLGARRGVETVLAAGEYAPHLDGQDLRHVVSGAMEIQKAFPEYNSRQAVAQVFQSMAIDRSEDAGNFAKNVATGVAQLKPFGAGKDSYGFLSAYLSSITQRAGDSYGAVSRTAGINFAEQILTEGVGAGLFHKNTSLEQQLSIMRGKDPRAAAIRNKLLGALSDDYTSSTELIRRNGDSDGQLHTRAQTMIALSELLKPTSQTARMLDEFRQRGGGTPSQVQARQDALNAMVTGLPGQQAFHAERNIDVGMTELRGDPARALKASRNKLIAQLYEAGGVFKTYSDVESFVDTGIAEVEDLTPAQQFRAMQSRLRSRRQYLEQPKTVVESSSTSDIYGYGVSSSTTTRPPTAGETRAAKALENMEKMMERQAEILEMQLQIMQSDGSAPRQTAPPRNSPANRLNDR